MKTTQEALQALFGDAQVTELPETLESWKPTPEIAKFVQDMDMTITQFLKESADTFASDPSYFNELTDAALKSRTIRARVSTRRENRTNV